MVYVVYTIFVVDLTAPINRWFILLSLGVLIRGKGGAYWRSLRNCSGPGGVQDPGRERRDQQDAQVEVQLGDAHQGVGRARLQAIRAQNARQRRFCRFKTKCSLVFSLLSMTLFKRLPKCQIPVRPSAGETGPKLWQSVLRGRNWTRFLLAFDAIWDGLFSRSVAQQLWASLSFVNVMCLLFSIITHAVEIVGWRMTIFSF